MVPDEDLEVRCPIKHRKREKQERWQTSEIRVAEKQMKHECKSHSHKVLVSQMKSQSSENGVQELWHGLLDDCIRASCLSMCVTCSPSQPLTKADPDFLDRETYQGLALISDYSTCLLWLCCVSQNNDFYYIS